MDLRDYPRPLNDTGIGVHWSAGYPVPSGLGLIKDTWLPELLALGVKWVKIARGDGGVAFDELLLANGIMPIVRLYRPQPNPGTLDENQVRQLKEHVAAGVRYFEFNNEPDLGHEWANSALAPNGPEIVARNAIQDMETILAAGGYPGIPAVAVGCRWDLVGEICRQGRRDIFREGVWQAVHNYSLNHPLDYPYDAGNQQGAPYTQEFYDGVAARQGSVDGWGGRSLEQVNRERRDHSNPGATAYADPSCWRAYERFDQLIRAQIGRSLPILGTEDGYIVGERFDPRYPATTPDLHLAQTLEACRSLMGSSTRYERAPDWFFCSAFWLLGNYALGHYAQEWEGAAWYSPKWPGGQLPVVAALKAEPKPIRGWHGDGGIACQVSGSAKNGQDATLRLARGDAWVDTTRVAADGRYTFIDVPPERYALTVVEAPEFQQEVVMSLSQPAARADFDLTGVDIAHFDSVVRGTVSGGAGLTILLGRPADGWTRSEPVGTDGTYRFAGLGKGSYTLVLVGTDTGRADILLDGRNEAVADLVYPGWGWQLSDGGVSPGFGVVRCRVTGKRDVALRLWTNGWSGMIQRTGSKMEYGPDACEFAPLGSGSYTLQPVDGAIERVPALQASLSLDGSRVVWITYIHPEVSPPSDSVISGHVKGGSGLTLTLAGPDGSQQGPVGNDEDYRFAGLGAGIYRVEVAGTGVAQDGIVLDGENQLTIDFVLAPAPKTLDHYLLVGNLARTRDDFLAVLQYVKRFQPPLGNDPNEARTAQHVTILGATNTINAAVEEGLREAGCQVQRIEVDYAGGLGKLLAAGRPY